jgi:uncharacterized HhH-GPD family protein
MVPVLTIDRVRHRVEAARRCRSSPPDAFDRYELAAGPALTTPAKLFRARSDSLRVHAEREDQMPTPSLHLAQEQAADDLLTSDPLALLMGMLLDQQFPLERAFAGPWVLSQRLPGGRLDVREIAGFDPDAFAKLMAGPPAVHRYPAAMAGRIQAMCRRVVDDWDGNAAALWATAPDGAELLRRVRGLPGFGEQKARIFVALLGKQLGVRPDGWREAAGPFGEDGSYRSVADVTDADSLGRVRAFKQAAKAARQT